MTSEWKAALAVSLGVHATAFAGLPATAPAAFDVERAPTSVELYLVPAQPAPVRAPLPEPPRSNPAPSAPLLQEEEVAPQAIATPEVKGADVEVRLDYLRNPPPAYPRLARERGEEGTVLLEVQVLVSGRCGQVNVLTSSGFSLLDQAALRAVRAWVFRPARRWGQPAAFWVEIPITFRLLEGRSAIGVSD